VTGANAYRPAQSCAASPSVGENRDFLRMLFPFLQNTPLPLQAHFRPSLHQYASWNASQPARRRAAPRCLGTSHPAARCLSAGHTQYQLAYPLSRSTHPHHYPILRRPPACEDRATKMRATQSARNTAGPVARAAPRRSRLAAVDPSRRIRETDAVCLVATAGQS